MSFPCQASHCPVPPSRQTDGMPWHKRPFDCAAVLLALPVVVPLMLLVALLVLLTSRGPAFFVQTRVGRGGQRFGMIKFRSMYADAEARLATVQGQSDRPGLCFKRRDDPRITPLGRFLRRSSLDELPQLLNVLWGDMSLVGPRPALPAEVAQYPVPARARLQGLPGITGLWQVSGRADLGFDEMVALDIAYLRAPTLCADLKILARTLTAVARGHGAY